MGLQNRGDALRNCAHDVTQRSAAFLIELLESSRISASFAGSVRAPSKTDESRRASMALSVSEGRWIWPPVSGTRNRSARLSILTCWAAVEVASTGATARRLIQYPPALAPIKSRGAAGASMVRKRCTASKPSSKAVATWTVYGAGHRFGKGHERSVPRGTPWLRGGVAL